MRRSTFIGTCMESTAEDIHAYDDTEKVIKYRTFLRHVGRDMVREINEAAGVPIHKDWHVVFGRGTYRGKPVVCMHHSHIHHFYTLKK